jgi:hypothetical protein
MLDSGKGFKPLVKGYPDLRCLVIVLCGANLDTICSSASILLASEKLALWYANLCLVVLAAFPQCSYFAILVNCNTLKQSGLIASF